MDGDKDKTSPVAATKKSPVGPPRPETAWERGLRQAREMRKLAKQGRSSLLFRYNHLDHEQILDTVIRLISNASIFLEAMQSKDKIRIV